MKTIKIKNEDKSYLKEMGNRDTDATIMMNHGAALSRKTEKELWEFLHEKYSLNFTKSTRYSFNIKTMEIKEITQ
ncbi:MAG: hypothetical protein QQN55_08780 [Nitrosopumilus sp.]